jgi:hypothetical protein
LHAGHEVDCCAALATETLDGQITVTARAHDALS